MKNKTSGKRWYSFDDIGQELFGLKPQRRVTRDKNKLEDQRSKFVGTCPHCGQPLHYVYGTNVVVCDNEDCKGKKVVIKNSDGSEEIFYKPYSRILNGENSTEIGMVLFDEKEKKDGKG